MKNNSLIVLLLSLVFHFSTSAQTKKDSTFRRSTFGMYGNFGKSQALDIENSGANLLEVLHSNYIEFGVSYHYAFTRKLGMEATLGIGFLNANVRLADYVSSVSGRRRGTFFPSKQSLITDEQAILGIMVSYRIIPSCPLLLKIGVAAINYSKQSSELRFYPSDTVPGFPDRDAYSFRGSMESKVEHIKLSPQFGIEFPFKLSRRHFSAGVLARYSPFIVAEGSYEFRDAGAPSHGTLKQRNNIVAFQLKWLFRRDPREN